MMFMYLLCRLCPYTPKCGFIYTLGRNAFAAAVVLVFYVPFIAIAPHGVLWSLRDQGTRPLQIESAGALRALMRGSAIVRARGVGVLARTRASGASRRGKSLVRRIRS